MKKRKKIEKILLPVLCFMILIAFICTSSTKEREKPINAAGTENSTEFSTKIEKETEAKKGSEINKETEKKNTEEDNGAAIENKSYDIISDTYVEKTENVDVEINYPIVINMKNKDMENKINNIIKEKCCIGSEPDESDESDESFKTSLYTDYEITEKTEDILSMYFTSSILMEDAAHPSRYLEAFTMDLKIGKVLKLKDLFKKDTDYKKILNSILYDKIIELDFKLTEDYKGIEQGQGFYLTHESLVIFYQEGIYTPYAYGPLLIEIPLCDIEGIKKDIVSNYNII